ncbi:hypothetical protein [Empedobacter tilapiae]
MGSRLINILKQGTWLIVCFLSIIACSQQKTDNNMKWISKFDFFDLYKVRVNGGYFNPGSAIRLEKIAIPNENTILLAGSKDENSFDENKKSDVAVLFASNDKGKSYKEILLNDDILNDIQAEENYTFIESYSRNKDATKIYNVQLLNNKTFELIKVLEYSDKNTFYNYFDGKYILQRNESIPKIINLLNLKEEYSIPTNEIGKSFFHIGDTRIVYKKNQEIIEINLRTKEQKVLSQLKSKYDYFFYIDNQLILKKVRIDDGVNYESEIYDIYENKLYEETNDNKSFYRYKNFICDYRKIGSKPEIRYSYDYGKTWTTHHVQGFTILQNLFGFYKDQFLVTEGIFWHFDSPESGGRIMVGEFEK